MIPSAIGLLVILVGIGMLYMGLHGWTQTHIPPPSGG